MALTIRPLTVDSWAALGDLFAEGGDARWCWCTYWRFPDAGGRDAAEDNSRLLRNLLEQRRSGPPLGLLAFEGEQAVGWVSLGPRNDYPRLQRSRLLAPVDERPVWSIVCFVVAKSRRRRGVAARLLEGAIDCARRAGAAALEAYPIEVEQGRVPGAYAYLGVPQMFRRAGFETVAKRHAPAAARPRLIMRLELAG